MGTMEGEWSLRLDMTHNLENLLCQIKSPKDSFLSQSVLDGGGVNLSENATSLEHRK